METKNGLLTGAVRAGFSRRVKTLIVEAFPKEGETRPTGKQGRPISMTPAGLARDYLAQVPATSLNEIVEDGSYLVERGAAFIDVLVEHRRSLTKAERAYLKECRDVRGGMPLLRGEPSQDDFYLPFIVSAKHETESLSEAYRREFKTVVGPVAQQVANSLGQRVYVILERMAIERNARSLPQAEKAIEAGEPKGPVLSLVRLMSSVKVSLTVTTTSMKSFKGALMQVATFEPERGRRTMLKVVREAESEQETVPAA